MSDYQTAQALATEAKTIFNKRLTTKVNPNIASATTILQLGKGLDLLSTSINNKTSYEDCRNDSAISYGTKNCVKFGSHISPSETEKSCTIWKCNGWQPSFSI